MNANELASELDKILQHETSWDIDFVETIAMQAALFLRQQQAEIEALKLSCPKCGGTTGKLEILNVSENVETLKHEIERLYRIIELNGTIK